MKEIIGRIEKKILKSEERIEKTVTVNFDGKQFSVRIPKRISDLLEIRKGNKIKFIVSIEYVAEIGKKTMVVELLD